MCRTGTAREKKKYHEAGYSEIIETASKGKKKKKKLKEKKRNRLLKHIMSSAGWQHTSLKKNVKERPYLLGNNSRDTIYIRNPTARYLFSLLHGVWWRHSKIARKMGLEPWVFTDFTDGHSLHRINNKHPRY